MPNNNKFIYCLAASITLLSVNPATAYDANDIKQLGNLETRFLGHSFSSSKSEKVETRVARLEKLVFGEAKTGNIDNRLESLIQSVSQATSENDEATSSGKQVNEEEISTPVSSQAPSSNKTTSPGQDQYPRVGAMEKALLGKSYAGEDLGLRLARMEKKSFGKELDSEALSDRTDALQKYIERKTHKKLFVPPKNSEVATRQPQQEERSRVPGLINAVSTALFGPAGNGTIGGINTGMMGFGGIRVRNRADVQRQEMARLEREGKLPQMAPPQPVEDPLVKKASMPPKSAKMKTKVGWCEVQLYGRTFPTKHLLSRLEQINGELEYKPGIKGIKLMDDVDSMVKLVYSKNPHKQVSSKSQPKAQ